MRSQSLLLIAIALIATLANGCSGGTAEVEGGILDITGQAGDTILVQRSPTVPESMLCCSTSHGCRQTAMVRLAEDGRATVDRLVVPSAYVVFSNITGCFDFIPDLPCRGRGPSFCFPPPNPVASLGTIKVEGGGVDCIPTGGIREICNYGWVKVTINGILLSSRVLASSTPSSVANDLATKINSNPDLGPIVGATVSGNAVNVFARTAGVQYSYPWHTSCTYPQTYFSECPFYGILAPVATLAPR